MPPADRLLLTVNETCELTGFSKSLVYDHINKGDFPVIRLGRTVRIPQAWLVKWIEEHVTRWEGCQGS